MGTGRNVCPPEWAVQLTNLIQNLGPIGHPGYTGLQLQPLCDGAGVTVGYGAAVYSGATQQATMLYFDLERQPVATLGPNLQPCVADTTISHALAFSAGTFTSIVNGAAAGVALRGNMLQSLGGVSLGYLLPVG